MAPARGVGHQAELVDPVQGRARRHAGKRLGRPTIALPGTTHRRRAGSAPQMGGLAPFPPGARTRRTLRVMRAIAELDPTPYLPPPQTLERVLTPALAIHLDRVRRNVGLVLERLGGDADRWRPHVKTTKTPAVWRELVRAGVRHFKCATTREAARLGETLADEDVRDADVLVAYPLVGPALARLAAIAAAHPAVRWSVLVETPEGAESVPPALSLFVDVDPGMGRTGIPRQDEQRILAVARACAGRFRGLHYYDGHRTDPDREVRRVRAHEDYDVLVSLVGLLRREGLAVEEITTSGTPSFEAALAYTPFTELDGPRHRVSPGTVVFHDARSQQQNPDLDLAPAAVVIARVTSRPAPAVATLDAGSKAIGADAGDPCAVALGRPDWTALAPSEEHLPMRIPEQADPARGEAVVLCPRHVCTTTNLHERALLFDEGRLLGITDVAARAHELETGG